MLGDFIFEEEKLTYLLDHVGPVVLIESEHHSLVLDNNSIKRWVWQCCKLEVDWVEVRAAYSVNQF